MSGAAAGATAAGTVISALGSIYSGQATSNALNTQATQADQNAQLATEQGQYNSMRIGMQVQSHLGQISAGYGASGVSAGSGSVLNVLMASTMAGEMDKQNAINSANVHAINYENEASIERVGAGNAVTASYLNALSGALTGGAKVFGDSSGVDNSSGDEQESDSADTVNYKEGNYSALKGTSEAGESLAALPTETA